MSAYQRLDLRQGQSLVMTPQLQQAIKLLQLSNIELAEFVAEEIERNPLLERGDNAAPAEADADVDKAKGRDELALDASAMPVTPSTPLTAICMNPAPDRMKRAPRTASPDLRRAPIGHLSAPVAAVRTSISKAR